MAYEPINLFSEIEKNKGFSEKDISDAENRLGFRLPKELRLFYKSQGKNIALKTQTGIIEPQYLKIDNNGWLIFWAEDVGVCFWAIKKEEFGKEEQNIYIRHDEYDFEKEAENLNDFLIIRAAGDCSHYVYPYLMFGDIVNENDEKKVKTILGDAKSDVNSIRHFHVKFFWKTSIMVVKTVKYSNNRGFKIVIYSKSEKEILDFKNKFPHINWAMKVNEIIIPQKKIKFIESPLMNLEEQQRNIKSVENDLPF